MADDCVAWLNAFTVNDLIFNILTKLSDMGDISVACKHPYYITLSTYILFCKSRQRSYSEYGISEDAGFY